MNTVWKRLKTAFLEMITMMNLKLSNRPLTLAPIGMPCSRSRRRLLSGRRQGKAGQNGSRSHTTLFLETLPLIPKTKSLTLIRISNMPDEQRCATASAKRFRYSNKMQIEPWLATSYVKVWTTVKPSVLASSRNSDSEASNSISLTFGNCTTPAMA